MTHKLAASFIVTIGLAACSQPAPEPQTPIRNPPEIVDPPQPEATTPEPEATVPDAPLVPEPAGIQPIPEEAGRISIDDGGTCTWASTARANPPPPSREVKCPPHLTAEGREPMAEVFTTNEGTCYSFEYHVAKSCPPGMHCNPPPPRRVDVACGDE